MRHAPYSAPKYLHNYPPQTTKKWPEDIECIITSPHPQKGSLYLSNVEAAQNPITVKKLKIGAILSCAKGYMVSHPTSLVQHYKYIPGEDKETFDISLHFEECVEFIRQALQKTNIIVHCIAGVSRSASMVIAYFMKHRKLSFEQAYREVKVKRKIVLVKNMQISPNDGFIKHLKDYELKLKASQSTVSTTSLSQSQTFERTLSGQFYSPKKTYNYENNLARVNTAANPQSYSRGSQLSSNKHQHSNQLYLKRNYDTQQKHATSPRVNNYMNLTATKSYSMTLIPDESKSPTYGERYAERYGSRQLSPRRQNNLAQKPTYISRENIYQQRKQQSGYFASMHEDLNQKYQAIRKKYDEQIQQLSKNRNANRPTTSYTSNATVSSPKHSTPKNLYTDRKSAFEQPIAQRRSYYNNAGRRDVFHLYDRDMGYADLKANPRLNNFDSIYVPRISTGYALGAVGYYPKRY